MSAGGLQNRWKRVRGRLQAVRLAAVTGGLLVSAASAASRFPQPQFETGHVVPVGQHPAAVKLLSAGGDAAVLIVALLLTAWAVLARRSRRLTLALSVLCVVWFGFVRHGCICPVGSTQNIAAAACDMGGLPWVVGFFFAAPLVAALLFGRVFCAGVCPLGAMQELAVVRPVRVNRVLDAVLRLLPITVLAVAVLFAATDAGYPICQTDPYVGFFRRSAPLAMLLVGVAVILLGAVVARPYCRYYCPYGVLLGWCARFSWRSPRITPDLCIHCHLCREVCPYDAILAPRALAPGREMAAARRRLLLSLLLAPVLVGLGALGGRTVAPLLARHHPSVIQQEHLQIQAAHPEQTFLDAEAFRAHGCDPRQLAADVAAVQARFLLGSSLAGAFLGLVLAWRLILLARLPVRTDYAIDPVKCVACGRCLAVCPRHQVWVAKKKRGQTRDAAGEA
jgi:ferredoxin